MIEQAVSKLKPDEKTEYQASLLEPTKKALMNASVFLRHTDINACVEAAASVPNDWTKRLRCLLQEREPP